MRSILHSAKMIWHRLKKNWLNPATSAGNLRKRKLKNYKQAVPLSLQWWLSYLCRQKQSSKWRTYFPPCLWKWLVVPCQRNPWLARHCKDKRRRTAGPYLRGSRKTRRVLFEEPRKWKDWDRLYWKKTMSKNQREENSDLSYIIPTTHWWSTQIFHRSSSWKTD